MNEFNQFLTAVAQYYKVDPATLLAGKAFAIQPPEAAILGQNIQQRSDFLAKINIFQVTDIKGKKLLGALEKGVTGRKKSGRHLATLEHKQADYELFETDSGVLIPWAMLDQFARFGGELAKRYAEYVQTQIALDQLQIGFNGTSVAENTSKADLSDVNKGWLQLLKEQRPENVYKGQGNKIGLYSTDAEFKSLDELALELKQGLDLRHQNRTDLVFLVGADLANAEARYITRAGKLTPTERAALGSHNLTGSFGGMPAITPPNFPAKGAVVTSLSNLSIYTQSASVRRKIKDDDDKKGVVDSYYRNEGYVVEDLGLMTAIDTSNVKIGAPDSALPA